MLLDSLFRHLDSRGTRAHAQRPRRRPEGLVGTRTRSDDRCYVRVFPNFLGGFRHKRGIE